MAKKKDPVAAKAAKQKKMAIVGGVLLLGLLAFQVPRTMKMLNPPGTATTSAASTAPATTTATGSSALAPPSLDGGSTAGTAATSATGSGVDTSADGVADPSNPLPPSSGQLMSFSQFKSKDPFRQQVQDCPTGDCSGAPAAAPSTSGGTTTTGTSTASKPAAPTGTGTSTSGAAIKATVATISVNGAVEQVSAKKDFPAGAPVFTLVSLTKTQAMIAIAGGSLESGATAVPLKLGKTLKLQNTADGTTYVLKLVATA